MAEIESAADAERGIRRLLAEACSFLDERRFAEWSDLFTEDATFGSWTGRTAIYEAISHAELATRPELSRKHTTANSVIDIDGRRAHAVSDLVMYDRVDDGPWTIRMGHYEDDLVRDDDRWRIAYRKLGWT